MPFRRDGSTEVLVPLAVPVCCHAYVTAELNLFAHVSKSHEVKGQRGHPSPHLRSPGEQENLHADERLVNVWAMC